VWLWPAHVDAPATVRADDAPARRARACLHELKQIRCRPARLVRNVLRGVLRSTVMPVPQIDTTPYWAASSALPEFPKLDADAGADVVIVGAGIAGLTAAYLLAKGGKQVVVLERDRCAAVDTGHTTAHLTMVTDTRLSELVRRFGRDHARAVWDAGLAAIAMIDGAVREHDIDAGFAWVDGYLHAALDGDPARDAERLQEDAVLAWDLGFDAEFLDTVPVVDRPGIRFTGQARVHPRAYLAGLARAIVAMGGRIHERSGADDYVDEPRAVTANGHAVRCDDVVIATHNPRAGVGGTLATDAFQTKLALYSSYVVAGRVPHGRVPDALWWDTSDPYWYLRTQPAGDHDLVIFGGEDHKTGQQADTAGCYDRLESRLEQIVPGVAVTHRWSGQVIETPDGLPYIGATANRQYAATGFAGNGMTFGTLGGMMIADAILGRANPWPDLFAPGRKALTRGLWDYLKENVDYPYYRIRDRFAGAETRSLRAVRRGHGGIVERQGRMVAAYRDAAGVITTRSAACTHMGCHVAWNGAERTWDCPCHGSRFTPAGHVISGPAESPLDPVD
jgi:glycine/D-amino acid oxidase-like deaminating enzyme/nitrite reductase/ring-hydroxylating ferredoxin subunit